MHESWCSIIRNKNVALYFVLLVVSFLHQPKWILTDQIGKMANGLIDISSIEWEVLPNSYKCNS